jgi:signal transduction histidine kinase
MPSDGITGRPGDALELHQLEAVRGLLDLLQVGFALATPAGTFLFASYWTRRTLGRPVVQAGPRALLGDELHAELCESVFAGRSPGARWRELRLSPDGGSELELSVRSIAVALPDGTRGALLAITDISAEVSVQRRYKELLAKQQEINQELRRRIASVLREHEDDIAQFNELLQIAPTIFASFVAEAEEAVGAVSRLAERGGSTEQVVEALRAVHTLKGNARSLGLNFIGGRAHEVEEEFTRQGHGDLDAAAARSSGLGDLVGDLRRAIERASLLRQRFGAHATETAGAAASLGVERVSAVVELGDRLSRALAALGPDHPARAELRAAQADLATLTAVPLEQLFDYLRATALQVAESEGREPPLVELSGGSIAAEPLAYLALSRALPHLVRNAVCHGLEPGDARARAGKPRAGRIGLNAHDERDALRVLVRDDGKGLDPDHLRAEAARIGVALEEPPGEDPLALIFHPGLSTAAETTMDKGRGMGASAARHAIEEAGGSLQVWSEPGQGVEFTITLPRRR